MPLLVESLSLALLLSLAECKCTLIATHEDNTALLVCISAAVTGLRDGA